MDTDLEKLITLNLKYSPREKSLNTYVFADFSMKALYQIMHAKNHAKRYEFIKNRDLYDVIAQLVGFKKLPRTTIQESLALLLDQNKVRCKEKTNWVLTSEVYDEIESKLKLETDFLDQILKNHFPRDISMKTLRKWFYEVSAELFGKFSDIVVANVSGVTIRDLHRLNLAQVIDRVSIKYQLNNKSQALKAGYEEFIESDDADDLKLITDLAIRWFGARLVVANVGNDTVTLDVVQKSKFLLDTNVLLAIALKRYPLSQSINALGKTLKTLDAELVYLDITKRQYQRTVDYEADKIRNLLQTYTFDQLKTLEMGEDFIAAAIAHNCRSLEDFNSFILSIRDLPESLIDGPSISIDDDEIIEKIVQEAESDQSLIKLIKQTKKDLSQEENPREVSEASAAHDAALIRAAEFLGINEERNVWSLTLDYGLKHVGIKAAGRDLPRVMGVETLIEFIALGNLDDSVNNQDFAPLLANIFKNHCMPNGGSQIKVTDLANLQASIKDAGSIPKENLKRMATVVARARLNKRPIESPEVQGELTRLSNKTFEKYDNKIAKANQRAAEAEDEKNKTNDALTEQKSRTESMRTKAIEARKKLVRLKAIGVLVVGILYRLLTVAAVLYIAYVVSRGTLLADRSALNVIGICIGIISFGGWVIYPIKNFINKTRNLNETVQREIDDN